jgi:hypothetical protein
MDSWTYFYYAVALWHLSYVTAVDISCHVDGLYRLRSHGVGSAADALAVKNLQIEKDFK